MTPRTLASLPFFIRVPNRRAFGLLPAAIPSGEAFPACDKKAGIEDLVHRFDLKCIVFTKTYMEVFICRFPARYAAVREEEYGRSRGEDQLYLAVLHLAGLPTDRVFNPPTSWLVLCPWVLAVVTWPLRCQNARIRLSTLCKGNARRTTLVHTNR